MNSQREISQSKFVSIKLFLTISLISSSFCRSIFHFNFTGQSSKMEWTIEAFESHCRWTGDVTKIKWHVLRGESFYFEISSGYNGPGYGLHRSASCRARPRHGFRRETRPESYSTGNRFLVPDRTCSTFLGRIKSPITGHSPTRW